jgi:hypothetical protein
VGAGPAAASEALEPLRPGQFEVMSLEEIMTRLLVLAGHQIPAEAGPPERSVMMPLMHMGLDSMALSQLKGEHDPRGLLPRSHWQHSRARGR